MATHGTTIDGKEYVVHLIEKTTKPVIWVRSVRTMEDGSKVEAFLSPRQWKAEERAKRAFSKEIEAYRATFS